MMLRNRFLAAVLLAAGLVAAPARADEQTLRPVAAAPGLVEPYGEEREIASQVIGIIGRMLVEENDVVSAGQPIAIVENSEQAARQAAGKAQLAEAQALLDKAIAGARPEEKREARDNLAQLDADLDLANLDYARKLPLTRTGASSQAMLDQSSSAVRALKARRAAAFERLAVLEAGNRVEDIAAARAVVERLKAETALADALLEKTIIRSPISGVILRRQRDAGEAVTNIDPTPIAIVGDLSRLRVRAEVDETDIGHIAVGQRVEISADAWPGRRFAGAVARIAQRLGAKLVNTGRPAEKTDMKVLQVLIDLDPNASLPVGLRVDVAFLPPDAPRVAGVR